MAKHNSRGGRANATGRNTSGRFVLLAHYMLRSPAWKTLSPNSKALLIDLWARHNGANNGSIAYAVRDAEEIGLSKDQASRSFKELTERGFLKMRRASTFSLKTKEARTWELTAETTGPDGGTAASKDFMRWSKTGTQSHQRDGQSHQRDTPAPDERKLPVSVAPARPSTPKQAPSQSHQRDTYNIPHGVGEADEAVRIQDTPPAPVVTPTEAIPSIEPAEPDQQQPTIAAGRQRKPRDRMPDRDPSVIDITDYLAGLGQPVAEQKSAADDLRAKASAKIEAGGKGTHGMVARFLGVRPCTLSNFIHKGGNRYSLNSCAEGMLREWVEGRRDLPQREARA